MVEMTRPLFVSFASKVVKEDTSGEKGTIEVFTQIQDCQVTDSELLEIRKIQEAAAEQIDNFLNKKPALGNNQGCKETQKKQVLTYKDGRPSFEEKEI